MDIILQTYTQKSYDNIETGLLSTSDLEDSKKKDVIKLLSHLINNPKYFYLFLSFVRELAPYENTRNKLFINLAKVLVENYKLCENEINDYSCKIECISSECTLLFFLYIKNKAQDLIFTSSFKNFVIYTII